MGANHVGLRADCTGLACRSIRRRACASHSPEQTRTYAPPIVTRRSCEEETSCRLKQLRVANPAWGCVRIGDSFASIWSTSQRWIGDARTRAGYICLPSHPNHLLTNRQEFLAERPGESRIAVFPRAGDKLHQPDSMGFKFSNGARIKRVGVRNRTGSHHSDLRGQVRVKHSDCDQ